MRGHLAEGAKWGRARPGRAAVCGPSCRVIAPLLTASQGRKGARHAESTDKGREDLPGAARTGREQGEVGADRERVGPHLAPRRRLEGRQEPVLHRLEQGGPAQAGQGNRHQGPLLDEQEAADRRPAQPLTTPSRATRPATTAVVTPPAHSRPASWRYVAGARRVAGGRLGS